MAAANRLCRETKRGGKMNRRSQRCVAAILSATLAGLQVFTPVLAVEEQDEQTGLTTLKVGSFNIAANKHPDLAAQNALCQNLGLEIVGLQEVDMNTSRNNFVMLREWAAENYPNVFFSKAIDFGGGEYGIGTVSQYPLEEGSTTSYEASIGENRVFQRNLVEKDGHQIAFYNTHMSYEDQDIRHAQMEQVKAAIEADTAEYIVITGDFNADQSLHEFNDFLDFMNMANGQDGEFLDTYNQVDPTMKVNSVDNILATRNIRIEDVKMTETKLSDHNLLSAELTLLDAPERTDQWLQAQVREAEDLLANGSFSAASRAALQAAIAQGETVLADTSASQEQLDEAAQALEEAMNHMSDPSALEAAIAAANALDETKYSEASWKALDEVLTQAELLDNPTAEEEAAAEAAIAAAVENLQAANPNLALKKPVTVSGLEVNDGRFTADLAVDGIVSSTSRVSFAKDKDEQWLQVDLEETKTISSFVLNYESQCPSYEIHVSEDGETFTKVYEASGITGQVSGVQKVNIDPVSARYVKYVQKERWKHSGNGKYYFGSLYEFEVYETDPDAAATTENNLALQQPVSVSGLEVNDGRFTAEMAVDGDEATRVSFAKDKDEQWLQVDLGMRRTVSWFVLNYESQCPAWELQVSTDGVHYTTVHEASGIEGQVSGVQKVSIEPVKARYVKYVQKQRWKHSGNGKYYSGSLYEFEVYRQKPAAVSPAAVLEEIGKTAPTIENGHLVLPEVPEGMEISLYGCDNRQVVAMDGTISEPLEDMTVNVLYQVTSKEDPENYARSEEDITFVVPGRYTEEESLAPRPSVMPGLREWKGNEGQFVLTSASRIVFTDPSLQETAEQIAGYLAEMAGQHLSVTAETPAAGDIVLKLDGSLANLTEEGYTMHISEVMEITSSAAKGVLYGGISATQMFSQAEDHTSVSKGLVRDYPKYEVRSGMLDVARTYVPLDYLTEMTKYMAYFKLNEVQVHINDYWGATKYSAFRLESETYPEITAKDGSYSKADYRQYQLDMKKYGIDVITEIDTPYHAECFRNIEGAVMLKAGALDIREESSYTIVENVLDEYLDGENPVIVSENFHIGTDEYDKAYSEEMRAWTDHFINYVNAKGYKTRLWGSLGSRGFKGETPVSTDATVNLWAPYWADVHETFDAGYDIINTCGGWLYIVPGANAGYPDRLNLRNLWNNFDVSNFAPSRNYGQGTAIMPKAHPQTKGAEFALWNDMTSFGGGFSWFDLFDRFKDAVMIVSEKTWYGTKTEGQTAEEFVARAESLHDKVPGANPGRYVDSATEVVASYDFSKAADGKAADASGNGYDAVITGGSALKGEVAGWSFDKNGSISLPFASMGYPYTVSFQVKLDTVDADTELFSGLDGRLVANVAGTGKLGFERCGYQFAWNYTIPEGKWVTIALAADAKNTTLYVNGVKIGVAENQKAAINNRKDSNTFMLPGEKLMNQADGAIASLVLYNRVLNDAEIADLADVPVRDNLALNKTATASSSYPGKPWTPDKAVDGIDLDANSRWSSKRATGTTNDDDTDTGTKEQWLMVDLGGVYSLDTVNISWEAACATAYDIEGSVDGKSFTALKSVTGANGGQESHVLDGNNAVRYLRILCKEPKTARYGYSIYELQAYGEPAETPVPENVNKMLLAQSIAYAQSVSEEELAALNPLVREAFEEALAEAVRVYEDPTADQDTVNAAWRNLSDKIHLLNFTSDKTELLALIAQAEELNPDAYEEESRAAFLEALEFAKTVAEDPAALDEQSIAEAISRLQAAMDALVKKDTLDLSLLQTLVNAVKDTDLSQYTSAGQDEFTAALAEAQMLLTSAETQDQVNASVARLHSAWLALRLKPSEEVLEELRGFQTMVLSLDLELFSAEQKEAILDVKNRVDAALNNPELSAAEAETLAKEVREQISVIEDVTGQKKDPAEDNKKPSEDLKTPDQSASDKKEPASNTDKSVSKDTGTAKSVKTAAMMGASGMSAALAAAAAGIAVLFRRRKK